MSAKTEGVVARDRSGGRHVPRHVPWHQSLGEKRCGSVFASREGCGGCCAPVDKECVVGDTDGEERAAARAVSSVVGREALRE